VGDRDDQPHEAASRRGAPLNRRRGLILVIVLAALAALWGAGGRLLSRRLDDREEATLAALAGVARVPLGEAEALVRREAVLLAQDAAVVEGVARHDWATLARGAVRMRSLTLEGHADLVLIADAGGVALAQIPQSLQLAAADTAVPVQTVVALRVLEGQPYLLARAPVRSGDEPIGLVVVAQRIDRLKAAPGGTAVALVAGDRLIGATLPDAPSAGWAAASAAGRVTVKGERFVVRPAGRLEDAAALALIPERAVERERGWLWALLAGSFAIAAAGATATVLTARRRGRREPEPATAAVVDAPTPSPSVEAHKTPAELAGQIVTAPQSDDVRSRELEALYTAALTMGSGTDIVSTAEQTLDVVLAVAAMHVGLVFRLDASGERLWLLASRGLTLQQAEALRERRLDGSHVGEAVRTRQYVVSELATSPFISDPDLRHAVAQGQFHTQLALPIFADDAVWGVMALVTQERRTFDANQIMLLQGVAHQVGLAVVRAALFAETQEKSRRLETLTRLSQGLSATLSGDQVLQRVVEAALELLGSTMARLWLVDDEGATVTLGAWTGMHSTSEGMRAIPVGEGLVGLAVSRRAAVTMPDVQHDARVHNAARLRAEGIASAAAAPLIVGSRVLGALAVGTREVRHFSTEELSLLQSLANQAAIAIDNARLFFDEQTRRAYLSALLEINTKIGALAPTETLLSSIAEEAARLLAVDNAGFRLLEGDDLVLAGLAGTAGETMIRPRLKVGESMTGRVVQAGHSLIFDIVDPANEFAEHRAAGLRLGYTKFLGVPLKVADRTIGVLTFRARRTFTPRDQELAEAFAGQAAIALQHSRLYGEARRGAERMRALSDLARTVSETLDPEAVGQRVADSICALLGARSSVLYRLADSGEMLALTVSRDSAFEWARVLPAGTGLAGLAARERRSVAAPDVLADSRIEYDERVRATVATNEDRALVGVPLMVQGRLFGALVVADRTGRVFDAEDLRLAEAFADQAALALDNARLYAETTRRQREAEELARLARGLTESLDVSDVVGRTVESVIQLFGAQSSTLRLMQPDGSLVALALGGTSREGFEPGHVLPPGKGILGRAVEEARAVWTADIFADPSVDISEDLREGLRRSGEGSILAVPLRVKGMVIGALGVGDRRGRAFADEEAHLLQAFADQAALALENARLFSLERSRRRQIAALAEIEREFAAELDPERLLALVVERSARLFDAEGAIYLVDEGGQLLRRAWTLSESGPERLTPGQGLVGVAATERRGIVANDYANSPLARTEFVGLGIRHAIAQPLAIGDDVRGVMVMARGDGGERFQAEELALLESFASQAAIALENSRLYRAAETRAARLRTLARLNHLVTSSLDTGHVLTSIAQAAGEIMRAPFVAFWVADEASGTLHMQAHSDVSLGREQNISHLRFGEGAVGWVAVERRRLAIDDIFVDGRFVARDWARERGFRSLFCMPILDQQRLLGVLVLIAGEPFRFGPDDDDLLQSFSAQAAAAIRNAELYTETRWYAERLRALEEVNRLVSSSLNVEEVLQNLARAIAQFFDAPYVSIWAHDAATQRLRRALTFGDAQLTSALHDELAVGEGAVGWVVQHREPILWTDAAADPRSVDSVSMERHDLRWLTAYPIAIGERVLGAFAVHRSAAWPVTPETASLMGSLAAQAAIALENARLYSETSRRLTETRALLEVAELLNSMLDSRTMLKRVTLKVAQVCHVDRCTLEMWDGDRVIPLMSQFADGRRRDHLWKTLQAIATEPPAAIPVNAHVIETRQPLLIEDTSTTTMIPRQWIEAFGLKSCLTVPLVLHDRVIGVMTLDYCERVTRFADWQSDLAMAIAGQLALALENTRLYTAAQERLKETRTLLSIGQVLSQPGPIEDVMRRMSGEVARAFGADMAGVYLVDPRSERLVPAAGYHVPKDLLQLFQQSELPLDRLPALTAAWKEARSLATSDGHADGLFDPDLLRRLPAHSALVAPAMAHGTAVGGLFLVWWHKGRVFPPAEIRLVEGVAAQVGLALENADLARQTQSKLAETQTLLSISRAVSSTLDLQGLARHFMRQVATTFGADTVGLWMVDETGRWLTPAAGYHVPTAQLAALREVRLAMDTPLYAEAASTLRPVFTHDAAQDPRLPAIIREQAPHRTHLWVPVVAKDRMIGGFAVVWWDRQRDFSESDLALIEAIAGQAGAAIENARLFEENRRRVEELSVLHELSRAVTGELDREALLESLRAQLARVVDVRNMVVVLRADDSDELEVALRLRDGEVDLSEPRRYPGASGVGLMAPVLESGRPLRTDDYGAECARRGLKPVAISERLKHWLGVPLSARDRVLGLVALRSAERPFTAAEENLLTNIAHLTALALASVRLYEERSRAFGELAAAQDELVRTERLRALGEMASGVAHDFNNLLASVLGRAQLLLRRVQEPQLRQWLQVIERAALDGAETVKRLQGFTRIRRDQSLVPLDINLVVRGALDLTQSRWKDEPTSRGIVIDVTTRLRDVPMIMGDAAELREAMTNLILNALDAMPTGGTLTLSSALVDDRVEVSVADTGVGIPPEVRDKVFDPFFTTKGPQGTGLGLSVTYGFVSRHGGAITVESEPGHGSTFRLSFPCGRELTPKAVPAPKAAPAVRSLRCLVVDDEPPVREVLGDILESAGHSVVTLGDGAEAIALFAAEPFDLVVTDLAMPRVSGWQVARAVKQTAPHVPVFLVTGFGVELSPEERRTHGVDIVLVKPLQIQEILDAVAEVARAASAG
jgi:GAF domain-containing protein/CheY-like chemotaxis protein